MTQNSKIEDSIIRVKDFNYTTRLDRSDKSLLLNSKYLNKTKKKQRLKKKNKKISMGKIMKNTKNIQSQVMLSDRIKEVFAKQKSKEKRYVKKKFTKVKRSPKKKQRIEKNEKKRRSKTPIRPKTKRRKKQPKRKKSKSPFQIKR